VLGDAAPAIGARLADFERKTGHQLVVAAFQSLDGESLEDYVNRLFRAWKPGSAKANDGVLFALFVRERRWRVEVGYGLEPVLADLEAAEIARAGVPSFQSGDYAGGVAAVVEGLTARLSGGPARPRRRAQGEDEAQGILNAVLVAIFVTFLILIAAARAGFTSTIGRRRRRGPPGWGGGFGGWGGGDGFGGGGFSGGGSSGGGGASGGW